MSSIFNPVGTVVSATVPGSGFLLIQSSTNATPIVVQIFAPTTMNSGDYVEINNHLVNTNANGKWTITVIDSTHFSLNGSVGNGVGANTGMAKDYSLTPVLQMPGDGDLASAANINAPIEGAACALPFLFSQLGTYRVQQIYSGTFGDISSVPPLWSTTTTVSTTFVNATSATGLLAPSQVQAVGINDLLYVTASFMAQSSALIGMFLTLGLSTNGGAYSDQSSLLSAVYPPVGSSSNPSGFTFSGIVLPGGNIGSFDFSIMVRNPGATAGGQVQLSGGGNITCVHLRPQGS